MRIYLKTLLLFVLPVFGLAQEKVITITPAMFDEVRDEVPLSTMDGWIFKQGSDTAWARKDINISGWKKLKPSGISAAYADKNGRVEGWFRIKIKCGDAIKKQQLGILWLSLAAADVYIDGILFSSYGSTGKNGKPFEGSTLHAHFWPLNVNFKSGVEYTIAVHFVDYVSPFPPRQLRSQQAGPLNIMLRISGPATTTILLNFLSKGFVFFTIWVSVCTILSLLFWLISIQNPAEKELRLIAVCTTLFALDTCIYARSALTDLSFTDYWLSGTVTYLLTELLFITIPLIVANIFKRAISRKFKVLLVVMLVYTVVNIFLPPAGFIPLAIADIFLVIVCIYYIVSSWSKLRGAQWCIVAGLLTPILFVIALTVVGFVSHLIFITDLIIYLETGFLLSFPFSMLVYVAIRFKEIIKEVRQNAEQVVQLSEEKKQEALSRQTILQEEVNRQTAEIRTTLDNLKATQTQLIQSEKMASLGELTAGIAHEIQNPLNFVNNFSEVSVELLDEMDEELDKGDIQEAKTIGADLKQNLQKIQHHGKRADFIVKGMLEHSRTNTGEKQLTDMNVLCDEFLKLSYHGLRAKDKSFNAEMVTHFDPNLPKVNVSQQDMGRVMLNLFNNAFYAVNQRSKTAGEDYKPEVRVTTSVENDHLLIKVKDNGIGIPDAIKDKIMQPFFTTKPTGEGTGLGLSLTYDMVMKGHGGKIEVTSAEGQFTEFTIMLFL
jgi:two-component system, NtrC family, sensor kinase